MSSLLVTNMFEARALIEFIKHNNYDVHTTSPSAALYLSKRLQQSEVIFLNFENSVKTLREITLNALSASKQIDNESANILTKLYGRGSFRGWEFWDKFYFFSSALKWKYIVDNNDLTINDHIILPTYNCSQDYYFSSNVTSELLGLLLARGHTEFKPLSISHIFPSRPNIWKSSYHFDESLFESRAPISLISAATCFYDIPRLKREFGNKRGVLDIESPYHDVPVSENRLRLFEATEQAEAEQSLPSDSAFGEVYCSTMESLGFQITPVLEKQILHWVGRINFQLRLYDLLTRLRSSSAVNLSALSNCDGGIMGPISSVFSDTSDLIDIYPHSYAASLTVPNIRNPNYLGSLSQQTQLSLSGADHSPKFNPLNKRLQPPKNISSIIIVLNEFDDDAGLPADDLSFIVETTIGLYSKLIDLVPTVKVRFKPGFEIAGIGLPADAMVSGSFSDHIIHGFDCCITIGQPTSIGLQFFDAGKHLIHLQSSELKPWDRRFLPNEGGFTPIITSSAYQAVKGTIQTLSRIGSVRDGIESESEEEV